MSVSYFINVGITTYNNTYFFFSKFNKNLESNIEVVAGEIFFSIFFFGFTGTFHL